MRMRVLALVVSFLSAPPARASQPGDLMDCSN